MTSGKVTKVLHLQTSLNLTCGITRYLQSLHNNHVDEFHMTVLCYDGDAVENLRENGVDVKLFNSSLTWYYLLSNLIQIIRIVKNSNISIIHSHHRWLDVLGSISAKLCGISSIMTCHSIVSGKKFLSYRSDRIIAVSSAVYTNLTEYFGVNSSRIILLRNGIDPSVYKKDNLSYTGIKNNAIGFVGRLTRDKGFDIFLSIGERILEINSEIKLIIAGDGELKEAISSLSRRYPSQVIYKGVVKNIESVYSEISFLIM
ncbi:MAG: glycosyltransferase family 4 protein, partial [Ignavibacteriaceae bacterium]|nr:glycosyltransferase family 4 protein [Ignavibacteriaceae bacterium]